MQRGLFSVLGAYDFFAKSLPGVAFLLGLLFLLPESSLNLLGVSITNSPLVVILILLSVGLLGTLVGEAVHIFAIRFEMAATWMAKWAGELVDLLSRRIRRLSIGSDPGSEGTNGEGRFGVVRGRLPYESIGRYDGSIRGWIRHRRSGLRYVFVSHRYLWERACSGSAHTPLAVTSSNDDLEDLFGIESNDAREMYPLVECYVNENGFEQSQRALARASFCRGMWVVLLSLTGLYVAATQVSYTDLGFTTEPIFVDVLTDSGEMTFVLLIGFLSLLFMLASASYKRKYVEYLLSEQYLLANNISPNE